MEAALFTLDVVLLLVLIVAIRTSDRRPREERDLGFLSFLNAKTDPVQKSLRAAEGRHDA
ncbi:hypothetical protein [Pseudorhodoferax sp. Leaf274]|uniref:hypothetical protein n=1 Tax=Pseudorhodoferax sp. Leaf274 TaxID=1736318 RepID=UPI000702759A|nr:hypothetical protein [Pseudorhodoferax sp. Leaf274]KQP39775.1 hypothetical protein ASF44_08590 [Pseudorhodoferax sp. Leaf274]